jgi:hypothetical protein
MNDSYQHAMIQIHRNAPEELISGFMEKLELIKTRHKHSEKTVESCISGFSTPPTLFELLVASYVINGGILFKYGPELEQEQEDDNEFTQLLAELSAVDASDETSGPAPELSVL